MLCSGHWFAFGHGLKLASLAGVRPAWSAALPRSRPVASGQCACRSCSWLPVSRVTCLGRRAARTQLGGRRTRAAKAQRWARRADSDFKACVASSGRGSGPVRAHRGGHYSEGLGARKSDKVLHTLHQMLSTLKISATSWILRARWRRAPRLRRLVFLGLVMALEMALGLGPFVSLVAVPRRPDDGFVGCRGLRRAPFCGRRLTWLGFRRDFEVLVVRDAAFLLSLPPC